MKAPIIVKWRYWNNGNCNSERAANYLRYIGTREGVEKFNDNTLKLPATVKQKNMIDQLLSDISKLNQCEKYLQYESEPTRGNASALISSALDNYPHLLDKKTYLDYIATRPGVESLGANGLFSDEGKTLVMSEEREKLNRFKGRVNSIIISLSREDAEATGFNSAEAWRAFMRMQKNELSRRFDIPMESLEWYGAFHNEPTHPHIHLLLYSTDPAHPGYITQKNLETLKRIFATEIFRHELDSIYKDMKSRRNELTQISREEISDLVMQIKAGTCNNKVLLQKMQELAEKIKHVKGKKNYAFLPPELKMLVNEITDELAKDARIKRLYDLWYDSKYAVLKMYTEHLPPQKPLSQEETFKPIRNAIIKGACEIRFINTHQSNLVSVTRLLNSACKIIESRINDNLSLHPEIAVDSKLRREIEAKKKGQNICV